MLRSESRLHGLLASLGRDSIYQIEKPDVRVLRITHDPEAVFVCLQDIKQIALQLSFFHVLASCQTEVQHGISVPFLFKFLHGKTLKEVFPALEIALEGGHQQRLAEPAWAAQEEILAIGMRHVIDISSLVDIEVVLLADALKRLYAYGI